MTVCSCLKLREVLLKYEATLLIQGLVQSVNPLLLTANHNFYGGVRDNTWDIPQQNEHLAQKSIKGEPRAILLGGILSIRAWRGTGRLSQSMLISWPMCFLPPNGENDLVYGDRIKNYRLHLCNQGKKQAEVGCRCEVPRILRALWLAKQKQAHHLVGTESNMQANSRKIHCPCATEEHGAWHEGCSQNYQPTRLGIIKLGGPQKRQTSKGRSR